jgi:hypothetical protein
MKPQTTQQIDGVTSTGAPSDLDHLDGLAAQVDADHTGTLPDGTAIADQPAPIDYTTEAEATVDTFTALVGGYCPAAGELWDQPRKQAVAAALAPVMEKYGFSLGALPPELTLIIVAGPLLYQTSKVVAAQMDQDKAKAKAKPKPEAINAATGTTEKKPGDFGTPEVARHPQTALYDK